jgi:hypothetical protein
MREEMEKHSVAPMEKCNGTGKNNLSKNIRRRANCEKIIPIKAMSNAMILEEEISFSRISIDTTAVMIPAQEDNMVVNKGATAMP